MKFASSKKDIFDAGGENSKNPVLCTAEIIFLNFNEKIVKEPPKIQIASNAVLFREQILKGERK